MFSESSATTSSDTPLPEARLFSALAYGGLLCLIPLALRHEDAFVQEHARQGLVLFIGEMAALTVVLGCAIVNLTLARILLAMSIVAFGLISLKGVIHALTGTVWKVPFVSAVASRINL